MNNQIIGANHASLIAQSLHRFEIEGAEMVGDLWVSDDHPQMLLVLLNGYQRPRGDFRAFRKSLHAAIPKLATFALDVRGSGESKAYPDSVWPEAKDGITILATEVIEAARYIINFLNLSHYSVLGISMGGMIAQRIAHLSSVVNNLILVSTVTKGSSSDGTQKFFGAKICKEQAAFVESFTTTIADAFNNSTFAAKWQRTAIDNFDATEFLAGIQSNTLIISGADDSVAPLSQAHSLAKNIPKAKLVQYDDVGHIILVEAKNLFVKDVVDFLT